MARALSTHALSFPPAERAHVLNDLRVRRDRLKASGCNYWLFEDPAVPGLLIEFLEARDSDTLRDAAGQVEGVRGDSPILSEVEF